VQPAEAHTPPLQTFVVQSAPVAHPSPTSQSSGHVPPQSMSVSEPFSTPSVQVAGWQTLPEHTWLWQSVPVKHPAPP
jgi:hypothetical protein